MPIGAEFALTAKHPVTLPEQQMLLDLGAMRLGRILPLFQ